jgi:N-acetyltransferase
MTAFSISSLTRPQLAHLLETITLALASPPLTESILKSSKAYFFLLPMPSNPHREKIVGCVIAQRISTAMAIATPEPTISVDVQDSHTNFKLSRSRTQSLVAVDASSGLFCHPTPLPTPLGITRLFVSSAHRRQGIATQLLSAAAATFIHACPLDPTKGQVAFTQPTEGGSAVMEKWGKGFVRIYDE